MTFEYSTHVFPVFMHFYSQITSESLTNGNISVCASCLSNRISVANQPGCAHAAVSLPIRNDPPDSGEIYMIENLWKCASVGPTNLADWFCAENPGDAAALCV